MTLSSRYSQPAIGFPRAPLKEFGKRKRVIAYLVDGGPELRYVTILQARF